MEVAAALGFASSMTALIGNLVTALQYINDFKNAIKEHEKWLGDLKGLLELLKVLRSHAQEAAAHPDDPGYHAFLQAIREGGTLEDGSYSTDGSFRPGGILRRLEDRVQALLSMLQPKTGLRKVWKRATYTLDKGDIAALFVQINNLKSQLESFTLFDHFTLSLNIRNNQEAQFKSIQATLQKQEHRAEETEELEIIKWLSPLEFLKKQKETYDQIFPTWDSLLESDEFRVWIQGRPWPLHYYGAPGAGKTVLSSILIKHLQEYCERQSKNRTMAVLFLYLDHTETQAQTAQTLFGSLLKQLVQSHQGSRPLPESVKQLHQKSKGEIRPSANDFCKALSTEIEDSYDRVYVIVDALDEFPEISQAELLTALESIAPDKLFDLCRSCRDEDKTCGFSGHHLTEPPFLVQEIRAKDEEIKAFVVWELERQLGFANNRRGDPRLGNVQIVSTRLYKNWVRDPKLKDEIPPAVVSKANGMFLLAKLHLDSLKTKATPADVRIALEELSEEIGKIYGKILQRIDEQNTKADASLALKALSWVVYARRPLAVPEFRQALAVRPSSTKAIAAEQIDMDILFKVTAGLITTGTSTLEGGSDTVSLTHKTAYEYFEDNRNTLFPPPALTNIAGAILTYLNFPVFSTPCADNQANADISLRIKELPFLAYAAQYWADHALADLETPTTKAAVFELLENPSKLASTVQAAWYAGSKTHNSVSWDVHKGVNNLHVCAYYGLDFAIPTLLKRNPKLHIDSRDLTFGQTPLMYACKRGYIKTVSTLLECGADVNIRSNRGSTAILEAISYDHPRIVHLLTKKPLDVNKVYPNRSERTALMVAVLNQSESIVRQLLHQSDIQVNMQDSLGYTALSLAATTRSNAILELLLNCHDIEVNSQNENGATALIIAAEYGNDGMVRQLLEHHADPMLKDRVGSSAISKAMDYGHTYVVEALLDLVGLDLNGLDNTARYLLHSACTSETAPPEIVHLLVQKGMDPNSPCKVGERPLHDASQVGRLEITEALLQLGADPSIEDKYHRTPFKVAWQHGGTAIMKALAKKTKETAPDNAQLPLWSHAKLGHLDFVRKALRTGNCDLHARDPDTANTALHWGVKSTHVEAHPDILQLLLEAGLSPDDTNDDKVTPLHMASYLGYTEDVEAMLKYQPQLELRDNRGFTALAAAQFDVNTTYDVAVTLIEGGASIDNGRASRLQATFFRAVERGARKAVELLMEKGADALGRSVDGKTALEIATEFGYGEIRSLLLARS
ncbi:P-loop containing nucleoside triphosphate hydrolase [Lasallia pustulata]|uniref:p-loop containing nucleoside triphosphate hydrolase n=1 Tax=Lasallia pustulata TaxID=136370 RepID=A0A1W5DBB1_9LECA|nr:P-loop containing nucleoside triphosphate hydrolase [Lasallia pustulata]